MPELPEVETIRRELHSRMRQSRITAILIRLPKILKLPPGRFRRAAVGARILRVHRRAKLVLIDLSSGWTIIIHLKMSGQLIWQARSGRLTVGGHPIPRGIESLPNAYSHVIVVTNRGTLFFNDQRQFGFVKLVKTDELERWLEDEGYGPEPLADDFTLNIWLDLLRQHARKRIKPTLLDQHVVAGVGNIYADESCWFARVKPTRRIASLRPIERRALYVGMRSIMNLAIRKKGTTADAYRTANGRPGGMLPFLKVYGRPGLACRRQDGGIIHKMTLAGRGTHFCPVCQR